jgi:HAD superfamily hydrolase (TIGR01509 family)
MTPRNAQRPALLVDLDGPITRLFPAPSHLELAAALADRLRRHTGRDVDAQDHVQVLREALLLAPDLAPRLAARASAAELRQARSAVPAPGARAFLECAADRGYAVAVVSNNVTSSVQTALEACGVRDLVEVVVGRDDARLGRLKPAPDLVEDALARLGADARDAMLYGDSVSDIRAAAAANVSAIGVTSDEARARTMTASGALDVVPDLGAALPHLMPVGRLA